jgi:hypothetical protein
MGLTSPFSGLERPPAQAIGLAAGTPNLSVRGIEVTQAIQDLQNSVVLIANKPTLVRVYIDPAVVTGAGSISGEVAWRRDGASGVTYLPAMNNVNVDPARPKTIAEQRRDLTESLNFLLPPEAIGPGTVEITVSRLYGLGGVNLILAPQQAVSVIFKPSVLLRVRAIGLRYRRQGMAGGIAPGSIHFAYLRSFLARAYPVASLEWSQIVVDANFDSPFDDDTAPAANAQIVSLRKSEVDNGRDPRTHYYGLVDDNNGLDFMRGLAYSIPEQPQPDSVASGPCGGPSAFAWDLGSSYAGWYGAHELGHTFGRRHPGFPSAQQDPDDRTFPYPDGSLTFASGQHVGFDIGDSSLNIPMLVRDGSNHHDVMSYGDHQWLSAYTYEAIFDRLGQEDKLFT